MLSAGLSLIVIALLVAADQAIKAWATAMLMPVGAIPLIPHVVELRYVLNTGAAFSMMSGKQTFLILFTGLCLCVVAWLLFFHPYFGKVGNAGLLLVLSGGIGNLIDRVLNGIVVDYINLLFMNFAVFNLADICVCCGVGLLFLDILLEDHMKRKNNTDGTV